MYEPIFLHMTLCLIMMYHRTGFDYKIKGSAIHKVSSKLTFNHGCDIDLEHSNPTFSLDTSLLMMIYIQIEFGRKRLTGLELIKDIVETVIFCLYKHTL